MPTIATVSSATDDTQTTSHPITLPSGISNGDIVLVLFSHAYNGATASVDGGASSAGWAQGDACYNVWPPNVVGYYFWKVADTTESLTISTGGASSRSAYVAYRVTGHNGISFGSGVGGADTAPNPPSLTPAGGSQEYLWIAGTAFGGTSTSLTGTPSGYDLSATTTQQGSSSGVGASMAAKLLTASTENPGAFTTSNATYWGAMTAAVAPGGASAVAPLAGSYYAMLGS